MRARLLTAGFVGLLGLILARTISGQVQPVPGPGSGIVTVQGEVDVRRMPVAEVVQRGEWRVSLTSPADTRVLAMPAVSLARPAFVRAGGRYAVVWPNGETETIAVGQSPEGAWVRATVGGRERWLNLAHARAIEEIK